MWNVSGILMGVRYEGVDSLFKETWIRLIIRIVRLDSTYYSI